MWEIHSTLLPSGRNVIVVAHLHTMDDALEHAITFDPPPIRDIPTSC